MNTTVTSSQIFSFPQILDVCVSVSECRLNYLYIDLYMFIIFLDVDSAG